MTAHAIVFVKFRTIKKPLRYQPELGIGFYPKQHLIYRNFQLGFLKKCDIFKLFRKGNENMGLFGKAVGGVVKPCVDVKTWIGYDALKNSTKALISLFKMIFKKPQKITTQESFSEVIERLHLTDQDLQRMMKNFLVHSYIYLSAMSLSLIYMLYLLWHTHWYAGFFMVLTAAFFCIKAIEANFHHFQIKQKKLDCTLKEWLASESIQPEEEK